MGKFTDRTGEININNRQGLLMTIIVYRNSKDIDVQFEDGTIVEHKDYRNFKNGGIRNPNYRIGESIINKQGLKMTIIEYINCRDITVQFEDGTIVEHKAYTDFQNGSIKHLFPYQLPDTNIILENVSYVYKDQVNYLYKCTKCGMQEIDTLENINIHSKHKDLKLNKVKRILPYQLPDSDIILQKIAYIRENDVNYIYKCNRCNLEDIDILENINNHKCK
jgi:DNA-directed RNA polymerase subunit RPC12/RpoP